MNHSAETFNLLDKSVVIGAAGPWAPAGTQTDSFLLAESTGERARTPLTRQPGDVYRTCHVPRCGERMGDE